MRLRGVGLIAQGAISQSFLARVPAFLNRLTLLMNPRPQVAARMTNALRAGRSVHTYAGLQQMKSIWVLVGEDLLDTAAAGLADSIRLQGRTVILCKTIRNSADFTPLHLAGARVATLFMMPEADERIFIVEGHPIAVSEVTAILHEANRKVMVLRPATKPLYISGLHLSAHLLLPWFGAAVESFRLAGLSRPEATLAVQAIASAALRAYIRAGEKALPREEAFHMQRFLEQSREQIRQVNPRLAEFYDADAGMWLNMVGGKRFWKGNKAAKTFAAAAAEHLAGDPSNGG